LKAGAFALAASSLGMVELLAWTPKRLAHAAPTTLPDIQFDIGDFIGPAETINGVVVRFGPVFTHFVTARLLRTPSEHDQGVLAHALHTIEAHYAFSPSGVFTFIAYGLPYFKRLPHHVVSHHMPRLLADRSRAALEEAVVSPTDVSPANPDIKKQTFNVPVRIEANDFLLTLRSDSTGHLHDVQAWLTGSNSLRGKYVVSPAFHGLFAITSVRAMFQQIGLPRKVADRHKLRFATHVNPQSPMWMGFADQQKDGSGPPSITTFQGNPSARFTTTRAGGDYFFNGAVQHLSHVIQDLPQFYADPPEEPFTERVQYMFRSDPIPSLGNKDQFKDGGGPAFLDNINQGTDDARRNAQGIGTFQGAHRMGHLAGLQRSSRAADGTPIHIRMDGPGFDAMDVPDHSLQPKLQFTVFVPTADFFASMRRNQAALDLVKANNVASDDNGIERFLTATRRQNFLIPPRRHRAFPLLELT
jgi:hypothetical protein